MICRRLRGGPRIARPRPASSSHCWQSRRHRPAPARKPELIRSWYLAVMDRWSGCHAIGSAPRLNELFSASAGLGPGCLPSSADLKAFVLCCDAPYDPAGCSPCVAQTPLNQAGYLALPDMPGPNQLLGQINVRDWGAYGQGLRQTHPWREAPGPDLLGFNTGIPAGRQRRLINLVWPAQPVFHHSEAWAPLT